MEKKELSEKELLAIVKEKFPEISWQIFEVFNNGWDNQVLLLDNSIVFRFPRNEYVKTVHQKEKQLLATIKKYVDINIPHYEFFTDDDSCVGYSAIVGTPMTVDVYTKKISEANKKNMQLGLARFLTQLHTIPINLFEKAGYTNEIGTSNEWANSFKKEFSEKCGHLFTKEETQIVLDYIQELQEKKAEHRVMTHSDVQEKNIFIDDELTHISGIIDFSDARIADAALDFDKLRDYGDEFVHGVYQAYQRKKDDNFLGRSRFYRKRLFIYTLMHAVEHKKDIEKNLDEFRKIFFENT
ncbi:MAG: phosphotransferase [candidate division SR1 bacterium]|nr:phosphotransferase [candidate division SR1 bacterium]